MPNRVWVLDQTGKALPIAKKLNAILRRALSELRLKNREVSLALVSNRAIHRLNRRYRGKNRPTDVLSFSQNVRLPSGTHLLGDIVISTPTARKQAKAAGRSA